MTKVVTFYSYKGGVGRTMALVNTAFVLAKKGWRVLMVDFDLEAPGMTHFFSGMLPKSQKMPKHDAIDLLLHAKRDLEKAQGNPSVPRPPRSLADYVVNIALPNEWLEKIDKAIPYRNGRLDLIPATLEALTRGQESPEAEPSHDYVQRIDELDLPGLFAETGPGHQLGYQVHQFFLDARFKTIGDIIFTMRDRVYGAYDIVLLDSRTGLNEISGLCIGPMSDALVICCGLNQQNVQGVRYFMDKAGLFDKEKAKPSWVIAGPVPPWRTVESKARMQEMREALRTNTIFEVPYHPAAAITETIFVLTEPNEAITEAYGEFGSSLAKGMSTERSESLIIKDLSNCGETGEEVLRAAVRRQANILAEMSRLCEYSALVPTLASFPTLTTLSAVPCLAKPVRQEHLSNVVPLAAAVSAYRLQSDRPFRHAWKLLSTLDDPDACHNLTVGLAYFQLRVIGSLPDKDLVGKAFDVLTSEDDRDLPKWMLEVDRMARMNALAAALYIDGYEGPWRVFRGTDETCETISKLLLDSEEAYSQVFPRPVRSEMSTNASVWASLYPKLVLAASKAEPDNEHRRVLTKAVKVFSIPEDFRNKLFPSTGEGWRFHGMSLFDMIMLVKSDLGYVHVPNTSPFNILPLMVSATALVRGPRGIKDILYWISLVQLTYGYAWRVMVDWRHLECVKDAPAFVAFLQAEDEWVNEIESAIDKGVYAL